GLRVRLALGRQPRRPALRARRGSRGSGPPRGGARLLRAVRRFRGPGRPIRAEASSQTKSGETALKFAGGETGVWRPWTWVDNEHASSPAAAGDLQAPQGLRGGDGSGRAFVERGARLPASVPRRPGKNISLRALLRRLLRLVADLLCANGDRDRRCRA